MHVGVCLLILLASVARPVLKLCSAQSAIRGGDGKTSQTQERRCARQLSDQAMSLSSSVHAIGIAKQVEKTENGAKPKKQRLGGHAPNATDMQSGTGSSCAFSPSPSLTPPPFPCLSLTKPMHTVSESQQGSRVSSACDGATSNEQNPLKLRETAKRHSAGVIAGASLSKSESLRA